MELEKEVGGRVGGWLAKDGHSIVAIHSFGQQSPLIPHPVNPPSNYPIPLISPSYAVHSSLPPHHSQTSTNSLLPPSTANNNR